jgi:choline-sulfatase
MGSRAGTWKAGLRLLLGGAFFVACGRPSVPDGPSFLLITVDTLRADALEPYGAAAGSSPAIARFASEGIVFEDAQSAAPWTLPSFASLFTSQPVSSHGCDDFRLQLSDSFETLAEHLVGEGWDTACVISQAIVGRRHSLDQGFVHVDDGLVLGEDAAEGQISSPYVAERAEHFLRAKAAAADGRPWFLWLHLFDPHTDYLVHEGFESGIDGDAGRYAGEVAFTDAHVGRILQALAELGLADSTVVILTTDHGEEFGDHGRKGHAHSLYSELVYVPLVVRVPGLAPRRVRETVRSIDLYPTVCELAGLPVPEQVAGQSFAPALRGAELEPRAALAQMSVGEAGGKSSLVLGPWKLIRSRGDTELVELFHRPDDPREQANLAAQRPEIVRELSALLEAEEARAAERGRAFGRGREVVLGIEDVEQLRALGYMGN